MNETLSAVIVITFLMAFFLTLAHLDRKGSL